MQITPLNKIVILLFEKVESDLKYIYIYILGLSKLVRI